MTDPQNLAVLAAEKGVLVRTAANLPVDLGDPDSAWYVESGAVDVFFVERREGRETAALQHVLHVAAGRLLLGAAPGVGGHDFSLVAKGLQNTVLRRLESGVLETIDGEVLAEQVELWISGIASALSRRIEARPKPDLLIDPGTTVAAEPGVLSARRGVVWLPEPAPGSGLYMGVVQPEELEPAEGKSAIPLSPESWIDLFQPSRIAGRSSLELAREGVLAACVHRFHALAFAAAHGHRRLSLADDANLQREQTVHRRTVAEQATYDLFNLLNDSARIDSGSELFAVLAAIGRHEGISFEHAGDLPEHGETPDFRDTLDASGVRCRRIRLRVEDRWWIGDSGALLGFRSDSGRPVALLPGLLGRYCEIDPANASRRRVTAPRAADLRPEAYMFYTPLRSSAVGLGELARLSKMRIFGDLTRFVTTGVLAGLSLLFPAVLVGLIADRIIPDHDRGLLYSAIGALATLALLGAVSVSYTHLTLPTKRIV